MDYNQYREALRGYIASHPDPEFNPGASFYGGPQAEVSGYSTEAGTRAWNDEALFADKQFKDWMSTMPPEQQAEYTRLQRENYQKATKKMRLAALASFGGIAGAGALGAGLIGGGAGAGAVPSFAGNAGGLSLGGGGLAAEAGLASGATSSSRRRWKAAPISRGSRWTMRC